MHICAIFLLQFIVYVIEEEILLLLVMFITTATDPISRCVLNFMIIGNWIVKVCVVVNFGLEWIMLAFSIQLSVVI